VNSRSVLWRYDGAPTHSRRQDRIENSLARSPYLTSCLARAAAHPRLVNAVTIRAVITGNMQARVFGLIGGPALPSVVVHS
jgi:hypothetical protein